ncbi:hypothetical protein B2G69_10730 [Methylorubrum zatmanii]|nr:hypothetical protein B2G69_10730 [Methylorubrum zatmanii]
MRFDCNTIGEWMANPDELAAKLGISTKRLLEEQALGLIRVRVESGSGEDQGRSRITVQNRDAQWRGIFDESGDLIGDGDSDDIANAADLRSSRTPE